MKIVKFSSDHKKKWENFLSKKEYAGFIYSLSYKAILEEVYRLKSHYLMFYNDKDELVGILPMFQNRNTYVSQPFVEYGGILCEKEYAKEIERALWNQYSNINLELKYNYNLPFKLFKKKESGEVAHLNLDIVDDNYLKRVERSVRKNINKARRNHIEIEIISKPKMLVKEYYEMNRIYQKKHHGSPYHPINFYEKLFNSESTVVAVAKKDKKAVGFLMGCCQNKHLQILEIISDKTYWYTRFPDLLHYELILWAKKGRFKLFDFGIVRYEGQKKFKKKWNTDFFPYYIFYNNKFSQEDPDSFRFKILRGIWKKYIPFFITDLLSFYFRKHYLQ